MVPRRRPLRLARRDERQRVDAGLSDNVQRIPEVPSAGFAFGWSVRSSFPCSSPAVSRSRNQPASPDAPTLATANATTRRLNEPAGRCIQPSTWRRETGFLFRAYSPRAVSSCSSRPAETASLPRRSTRPDQHRHRAEHEADVVVTVRIITDGLKTYLVDMHMLREPTSAHDAGISLTLSARMSSRPAAMADRGLCSSRLEPGTHMPWSEKRFGHP